MQNANATNTQNATVTVTVEIDVDFLVGIIAQTCNVLNKDKLIEYFCNGKYASALQIDAEYLLKEVIVEEGIDEDTHAALVEAGVLAAK